MRIKTRQTLVEGIVANVAKEKLVERIGLLMDDFQLDQLCSGILTDVFVDKQGLTEAVRNLKENNKVEILSVEYAHHVVDSEGLHVYYRRTVKKEDGTEETDKWTKTWTLSWDDIDNGSGEPWLMFQIV